MIEGNKTNRTKGGEAWKIEEIYLDTWEALYRFIYYKVQNREEAEDITQETYARAVSYLKRHSVSSDKYINFLKTVANNLLRDKWRRKKRYGTELDLEFINPEVTATSDYAEEAVQREIIKSALNSLGEEQRQVVTLRIIEGYSVAETARIMGKSQGAVRSLQYRAIQNLSRILKPMNEY